MKLIDHVLQIRGLIQQAIDNTFSRLGLEAETQGSIDSLPAGQQDKYKRLAEIISTHERALGDDYAAARREAISECVFTLFNRLAAIKVMEDRELFPEVIRRRAEHGNLSYAHQQWLEEHPEERSAERMGLKHFLQFKFQELFDTYQIPIYSDDCPYAVFPTADELDEIINTMNAIEQDADCGADIWKGDDILGWLYENFNTAEKLALKDSGDKTEYDKVSLQSQVYTPRWVVKFLVDNTLGKMYLEMYPDSKFTVDADTEQVKYLIANAPKKKVRRPKPIQDIHLIDPACGSGNFLIYAFTLFYDLYIDQIENYKADISRRDIPRLIVENNLYGVDLDERAVQLTQTALYIKAMELKGRRGQMPAKTHVVSTHFELPTYEDMEMSFEMGDGKWNDKQKETLHEIWEDLRNAYKFGSLVRVKEKFEALIPDEEERGLFDEEFLQGIFAFKNHAMTILRNQTALWNGKGANDYAHSKVNDAMTFLDILSNPFDIAVANPPYTDSANFGPELKAFVEENYRKPLKFNINLYATFIKRCCELTDEDGKIGMIHPHTFMFIKTFEDVREFMIEKTHINVMVDYGLDRVNLFGPGILLDATFYTLDKGLSNINEPGIYFNITANQQEKFKKASLMQAYQDLCDGKDNERVYHLPQSKLKEIKSYPFIYWISDEFREKFCSYYLDKEADVVSGLKTGKNEGALRYWWEVENIEKWTAYTKGGAYNKWYGNIWLTIDWKDNGNYLQNFLKSRGQDLHAQEYYFKRGITYSSKGSGSISFRDYSSDLLFDIAGSCIFRNGTFGNLEYYMGFLNSNLVAYIIDCLNPTVNKQPNDLKRIPFVIPKEDKETLVSSIVKKCVSIKKHLSSFSIIEPLFAMSPITAGIKPMDSLLTYYNYENALLTQILLNEAIINETVFDIYELSAHDRQMVLDKEGIPVGSLPVSAAAKAAYTEWLNNNKEFPATAELNDYLAALPVKEEQPSIDDFETLYQNNNGWEEFCIKHQMNPIEVWYQFKNAHILPPQRTQTLAFELITDVIRTVLAKDDDGVIPLSKRLGEDQLSDRIEQELNDRGYSAAQISQIIQLLGSPLDDYLLNRFFQQLSDHLNLFMYLPKTPFIWHITSGTHHALEVYISIYKWSRNTLMRIKSVYAAHAETQYNDRLTSLDTTQAADQIEADDIKEKLKELRTFTDKIDILLASGYDPTLDDGVGKNIAPLQQAGLLSYEVLNPGQLNKYLNADW
jgi:hypothetical protein